MKTRFLVSLGAFLLAISAAYANRPTVARTLYTKTTSACHLIFCAHIDIQGLGICPNTHTKFTDSQCIIVFNGPSWLVNTP